MCYFNSRRLLFILYLTGALMLREDTSTNSDQVLICHQDGTLLQPWGHQIIWFSIQFDGINISIHNPIRWNNHFNLYILLLPHSKTPHDNIKEILLTAQRCTCNLGLEKNIQVYGSYKTKHSWNSWRWDSWKMRACRCWNLFQALLYLIFTVTVLISYSNAIKKSTIGANNAPTNFKTCTSKATNTLKSKLKIF